MSTPLLLALMFTATFAFVGVGIYFAANFLRRESGVGLSTEGFPDATASSGAGLATDILGEEDPILLRTANVSSISFWGELLERFQFADNLKRMILEAGLDWSVGRFTALMLLAGASMAVILYRIPWLPSLAVPAGGVLAMLVPFFYVSGKRQKRLETFEQNFPDALDSLGRAMRAGNAFSAGMELVANEAMPPVSQEFRATLDEWRLGQSWDQALDHLAGRVPLTSVRLFVAAIRVQSRTGGKLTEVLGRISESVREAASLEGEVKAISAHGKMTGGVLTILPIGIALMLHSVAPGYLEILETHPLGRWLVFGALSLLVMAHFVIRKILDIKV
jgi:tight adherence protein B